MVAGSRQSQEGGLSGPLFCFGSMHFTQLLIDGIKRETEGYCGMRPSTSANH
jgi:hypothetical protein